MSGRRCCARSSAAIGEEPRLFKDSWLHELAALYGLGDAEVELLACCRGEEGYPVDPAALRAAFARTLRTQSASGDHRLAGAVATRTLSRDIASFIGREPELRLRRPVGARFPRTDLSRADLTDADLAALPRP